MLLLGFKVEITGSVDVDCYLWAKYKMIFSSESFMSYALRYFVRFDPKCKLLYKLNAENSKLIACPSCYRVFSTLP